MVHVSKLFLDVFFFLNFAYIICSEQCGNQYHSRMVLRKVGILIPEW